MFSNGSAIPCMSHRVAAINGHPVSWVSIWKEQNYDESPIKSALAIKLCSRRWCRDAALCSVEGGLPLVGSHSSHASLCIPNLQFSPRSVSPCLHI